MPTFAQQAGTFVANLVPQALPRRAVEAARVGLVDCVGCMIAGANEPAPRTVARLTAPGDLASGAPEVPSGRHLAPGDAALVNGVAAHVLDYDDVALSGHPSTVLVPAILAEAHALDRGGQEAITAYVAGYELWALLLDLEPGQLHDRGFHPTAVLGTLATAAASARLHQLDPERAAHAIAIAASMASGLVANFGTMTKSFHAGRAAQSGILAARLAKEGFTASLDVLEHRTGFMKALSPSGHPRSDLQDLQLGTRWRMPEYGINVKRYPTCYCTHRAIDAMLDLAREHDLAPDAVREIRVHTGATQMNMLRNPRPRTGLEAKFSMEFAMAAALVARRVGLSELTDDFVRRPEITANVVKVICTTTDAVIPGLPFAPDDRVSVLLMEGRVVEHAPVVHAKGSWQKPLVQAELQEKFTDCVKGRFTPAQAARLFGQLWSAWELPSVRALELVEHR